MPTCNMCGREFTPNTQCIVTSHANICEGCMNAELDDEARWEARAS